MYPALGIQRCVRHALARAGRALFYLGETDNKEVRKETRQEVLASGSAMQKITVRCDRGTC